MRFFACLIATVAFISSIFGCSAGSSSDTTSEKGGKQSKTETKDTTADEGSNTGSASPTTKDEELVISDDKVVSVKRARAVRSEELGELPSAAGGAALTDFTMLVGAGGEPSTTTIAPGTKVSVGGKDCVAKAEVEVVLGFTAKAGEKEVVLVQGPADQFTCEDGAGLALAEGDADGAATFIEGYVAETDFSAAGQGAIDAAATDAGGGATAADVDPDAAYDIDAGAAATVDVNGVTVNPEAPGCADVKQVYLEVDPSDQEFKNNPQPMHWMKFKRLGVDPEDGCFKHKKSGVNKRIAKLEKKIEKAKGKKKERLQAQVEKLKAKAAKLTDGETVCIVPGPYIRREGQGANGDYALIVDGGGQNVKEIQVETVFSNWKAIDKKVGCGKLDEHKFVKKVAAADAFNKDSGDFLVPFPDILDCSPYKGAEVAMTVTLLDQAGAPIGATCDHGFREMSPLVLDLTGFAKLRTITPAESNVRFDLRGDGRRVDTGWIAQGTGFLTLDLNGNGKVDDGRELFGEGTMVGAGRATDGFAALAQYDLAHKGYVDPRDAVFGKLRVWQDTNFDGESQLQELMSLAELGITRIDTRYDAVAETERWHGGPMGNDVRYHARFFGPSQCGKDGCRVYDVYFGTSVTRVSHLDR